MFARLRELTRPDDSGLTLVEIVVYMTLAVVVGTIVVSMLIGTLKGQDEVTSTTRATTDGQLAASLVEKAVRNATAFQVTDGGKTLQVLTTLSKPCQQFTLKRNAVLSTSSRDVYDFYATQGAKLPSSSWPTSASGAVAANFVLVDGDGHSSTPFVLSGDSVKYTLWVATDLKATTDSSPNVGFSAIVTPRGSEGVISACS